MAYNKCLCDVHNKQYNSFSLFFCRPSPQRVYPEQGREPPLRVPARVRLHGGRVKAGGHAHVVSLLFFFVYWGAIVRHRTLSTKCWFWRACPRCTAVWWVDSPWLDASLRLGAPLTWEMNVGRTISRLDHDTVPGLVLSPEVLGHRQMILEESPTLV